MLIDVVKTISIHATALNTRYYSRLIEQRSRLESFYKYWQSVAPILRVVFFVYIIILLQNS